MKPNWINFKELRQALTFEQVLKFYGVEGIKQKGGQLVGFCPLPTHDDKRSPSFSAHPEKGIFQCFGCGAKGNVLDFAVLMEKGDPKRGLDVRKTALKLNKQFGKRWVPNETTLEPKTLEAATPPDILVNEPLNFRLKDLDANHPYLTRRGFAREVMERFGVGFCSKGVFAGRIAIPLHSSDAELIGYAGRVVDDSQAGPQNPKYLFPGQREKDGALVEFRKSLFVYNGYRFTSPVDDLIVVEGFPAVWWLTQQGFPEVVALMGSSASPEQLDLLTEILHPQGRLWILGDGDKAGMRCVQEIAAAIVGERLCRVIVREGRQPTDYTGEELKTLLGV